MSNDEKTYCVKMDDRIAEMVEIRRYGEVDGGFQRNLNTDTLNKIIRIANKGEAIPPIVLAKIEGKYRLLDGQHCFEAWKIGKFELWAQVTPMRPQKAIESFCTINGTVRKLALSHQLNVDPHAYAHKVREFGIRFSITNVLVHAMLQMLTGQSGRQLNISELEWKYLEEFLSFWTGDPRWGSIKHIYSRHGTLCMVVGITRKSKNPIEMLKAIQKLDFGVDSPLADRYGATKDGIRRMMRFALDSMVRKSLI